MSEKYFEKIEKLLLTDRSREREILDDFESIDRLFDRVYHRFRDFVSPMFNIDYFLGGEAIISITEEYGGPFRGLLAEVEKLNRYITSFNDKGYGEFPPQATKFINWIATNISGINLNMSGASDVYLHVKELSISEIDLYEKSKVAYYKFRAQAQFLITSLENHNSTFTEKVDLESLIIAYNDDLPSFIKEDPDEGIR
jgi:hypothetical protein